ncbi:uncharacterized protein LOC121871435 [Homarus americanus]|nr:uncharacterized protein LOC121871435 [Homarus americanus]XP_042229661.1 uncharacterized protein LOC121871435 [Homarus americanus]XP_042229662.1 uncharacterized protein LOC121871435 [Homarus americanus]XP_042229663.1 uncharacterized protein LOC121871435 [Homarus americanus]XP_042229664.1 uncharacterized protein LOC121871435 [Homarus americanus]
MGPVICRLLVVTLLAGTTFAQLPDGCRDPPGNNNLAAIIVKVLESVRPLLSTGIPDLGIPPLDPMGPFPYIPFHIDVSSLRLDGSVNDTLVKNLAQFIICQVNFTLGISEKFAIDLRMDDFHIDGQYDVNGLAFSLFPIFGGGNYILDVYGAGISGGAKVSYNPFSDHASIKNLQLDIMFKDLKLVLECILGCGDMADLINSLIGEIAPPMFNAIWDVIDPILTDALQDGINHILKNISISDIITKDQIQTMELDFTGDYGDIGNGGKFVDLVLGIVNNLVVSNGMDPAPLPSTSLNFGLGTADLYDGQLSKLSTLHRDGLATLDKIADWVFLYANIAVEDLEVSYTANVTASSHVTGVKISASIGRISIYMVARDDLYSKKVDLDQFVITEFGKIDVKIEGLGVLGYVLAPLTEAVANLVHEDIANILETQIKDYIQEVLNETPWP